MQHYLYLSACWNLKLLVIFLILTWLGLVSVILQIAGERRVGEVLQTSNLTMLSQGFKFSRILFFFLSLFNLNHSKWHNTEPNGSGTAAYYNVSGVYDTDRAQNHQVVCVQRVACKYLLRFFIDSILFKNETSFGHFSLTTV